MYPGTTAVATNKIKIHAARRCEIENPKFQLNIQEGSSTLGQVEGETGVFWKQNKTFDFFVSIYTSLTKFISEQNGIYSVKRHDFRTECLPSSYSLSQRGSRGSNETNDKLDDGVRFNTSAKSFSILLNPFSRRSGASSNLKGGRIYFSTDTSHTQWGISKWISPPPMVADTRCQKIKRRLFI